MGFIDLTNQRFGKWTVISRAENKKGHSYWNCECDCGTKRAVLSSGLKNGGSTNCGCYSRKFNDLTGQKFGRLLVISRALKSPEIWWNCLCDCTKIVIVRTGSLVKGSTKSCGCLFEESCCSHIDITNHKYGKLTAISYEGDGYWKCECECGTIKNVSSHNLEYDITKSCGCLRHHRTDLTKQKFGKLTVLYKTIRGKWKCLCDCGKEKVMLYNDLKEGHVIDCGRCEKPDDLITKGDLTGRKFGKLLVVSRSLKSPGIWWDCLCDCSRTRAFKASSLKKRKSCGCNSINKGLSDGALSSKREIFHRYKKGAEKRNLLFEINFDEFVELVQQDCYYCGEKPTICFEANEAREGFTCNGIDRLDNTKGYVSGNIVSACKRCNYSKADRDKKEFILWIKKCYENLTS